MINSDLFYKCYKKRSEINWDMKGKQRWGKKYEVYPVWPTRHSSFAFTVGLVDKTLKSKCDWFNKCLSDFSEAILLVTITVEKV